MNRKTRGDDKRIKPEYEEEFKKPELLCPLKGNDPVDWAAFDLAFDAGTRMIRRFLSLLDEWLEGENGAVSIAEIKGIALLVEGLCLSQRQVHGYFLTALDVKVMAVGESSYWTKKRRARAARLFEEFAKMVYADLKNCQRLSMSMESRLLGLKERWRCE